VRNKQLIPSQYNDLRQECGFKNVIVANRMKAEGSSVEVCPFLDASEVETFQKHKYPAYYWWVVLHELFGHGTGKMMIQENEDKFNFDIKNPPVNPLTGRPITSWYKPGQTWTGQFEELATTVDECRAELVGAYLLDDKELLSFLGFTTDSTITADDRMCSTIHEFVTPPNL
jgi:dipeptidyl-peptidase III